MGAEPNPGARETASRWAAERVLLVALPLLLVSTDCGNTPPAATAPVAPVARASARAESVGIATYYARRFHGRITASGIPLDQNDMVAAHPTYPFGSIVRVTNLGNGRSVNVRIVDRGPAAGPRRSGVIIDLSRAAAESLDFIEAGRSRVRVEQLSTE
jgi:rare lipoprotein A